MNIFVYSPKTESESALEDLLAKIPSNDRILEVLKPAKGPGKSIPPYEEAERLGVYVTNAQKTGATWFVYDRRQTDSYVTRCYTRGEAELTARAVAFCGAKFAWIPEGPMRGQNCVEGPDWCPHRRPDITGIHPNIRRILKDPKKSASSALAAHFAGLISQEVLHEILQANIRDRIK